MTDLLSQRQVNSNCDYTPDYASIQANGGQPNGCGSVVAYFYFICFHLLVTTIFLNLFIAVILNGFINSNEEESFEIIKDHIEKFKKNWERYDHEATGFIDNNDL